MSGHNSKNKLSEDDQRKVLFFTHVRARMDLDAQIKALQADKKAAGKLAQVDGFTVANLEFASKSLNASDKTKVVEKYFQQGEILDWLGLAPGFQADMFRDRAPKIEAIERDGHVAGLAAAKRESGYEAKSDENAAWERGYDAGQAFMRDNMKAAMDARNAEKAKAEAEEEAKAKAANDSGNEDVSGDLPDNPEAEQPTPPAAA